MIEDASLMKLIYVAQELRPLDRLELACTRDPDDYESLAVEAWASPVKHIALASDGEPVFAFGARPGGCNHLVQPWAFGTERSHEVMGEVTKFVIRFMIPRLARVGARRAQVAVHPENYPAIKWLAHLGFAVEAKLTGIGSHGEDMLLFSFLVERHERTRQHS
jgi:hypothetical protein